MFKKLKQEEVDVFVLNLNFGEFLPYSLASLVMAGVKPVVLDGGSEDNSLEVAKNCGVETLVFDKDFSKRIDFAIKHSDKEYVMFFASDCLLIDGFLERAKAFLEKHKKYGLVYGYSIPVDKQFRRIGFYHHSGFFLKDRLHYANFIDLSMALVRKEALSGFKLPTGNLHPDWLMWLHISQRWKIKNLHRPSIFYTIHDRQGSKTKRKILIQQADGIQIRFGRAKFPLMHKVFCFVERIVGRFLWFFVRQQR